MLRGNQATAAQGKVVVVRGDPLENPQLVGIDLGIEFSRHKLRGPDALDVPRVEILVADEAQKSPVRRFVAGHARLREVIPTAAKHGGGAMLEPTVAVAGRADQEDVPGHRGRAAEKVDVPGAQARQVSLQSLPVRV